MEEELEKKTMGLDERLTDLLMKEMGLKSEPIRALLILLSNASRRGYCFLEVSDVGIYPGKKELDLEDSLFQEGISGFPLLKNHLLKTSQKAIPVVLHGNRLYFDRLFEAEKKVLEGLERLEGGGAPLDKERFASEFSALKNEGTLTEEQLFAVEKACTWNPFFLTGGPGTGKTFTAGRILRMLYQCKSSPTLEIAVAAPTGKALFNLQGALERALHHQVPFYGKTLHTLLGISDHGMPSSRKLLSCDVLLVDEASMIDVELFAELLLSLKPTCRLILMGDPQQLPPVEGAEVFPRLVASAKHRAELSKCLRLESLALVNLANQVLEKGEFIFAEDVKRLDSALSFRALIEGFAHRYPAKLKAEETPETILKTFQKFAILTPLKKGLYGSNSLNQAIFSTLEKSGVTLVPIMITQNDYQLGLFNGETGVLFAPSGVSLKFPKAEDKIYFSDGKVMPAAIVSSFDLAFAMTVHKAQGSEFDEVLFILPEGNRPFSGALLYTAVTRAKKELTLHRPKITVRC